MKLPLETTIQKYIFSLKMECNSSKKHLQESTRVLSHLQRHTNNKPFKEITKHDIVSFLDTFRKTDPADPLHRWIATYNIYLTYLLRFFKWLYYPDISPQERRKPVSIENISAIKRKETSTYKPTDLWNLDDDRLFLRYCPSKRDRCYHAISRDSSCRPHEILKLRVKDIIFKLNADKQYAEILVNGKTGSRQI